MKCLYFVARRFFVSPLKTAVGIVSLSLLFFSAQQLFSQGNAGRILGAVTDQSGGAVVGSTVTITDTQRNLTRTVMTDAAGEYNVPNLCPAPTR
jgi:Carboxypeptidase regulatory-like domain